MTSLRAFRKEDIPDVVELHGRVFGASPAFSPQTLGGYFEEIFFGSPWFDESLPSLLSVDGASRLTGFLGVLPRAMSFQGRRLRVAVCTQFMVDPQHRSELAGIQLLKAFLSGPQNLSLADGANDQARRLWVGLGGAAALLYSLHWTRPLRPTRYVLSLLARRAAFAPLALAGRPLGALLDALAARMRPNQFHRRASHLVEETLASDVMLSHLPDVLHGIPLRPAYDAQSLAWLLDQAAQKTRHGRLRARAVLDGQRRLVGWYLYYVQPGGVSEVVQIAARDGSSDQVLQRLFADAWRQGAVAVSGRFDPRFLQELSDRHCSFRREGTWTLIHSREADAVAAIHRGDAFLSRLEGEWWMRFLGG